MLDLLDSQQGQRYFSTGEFGESELVIGLVGAVGTNTSAVADDLANFLHQCGYGVDKLRVSDLVGVIADIAPFDPGDEFQRIWNLMDSGDDARHKSGDSSVLALAAVSAILAKRLPKEGDSSEAGGKAEPLGRPRTAYILNSLKHPAEATALRRIYGDGFLLIGVYSDADRRSAYLVDRGMTADKATRLMKRDEEEEGREFGQRTRDTFHLADFFIYLDDSEDRRRNSVRRIVELVFGHPHVTPTFDEFAMFMAFSASLRSADLSRQVGAVVARNDEILSTGANDCPRYGGGLYWPHRNKESGRIDDAKEGRDYRRGRDSNAVHKRALIDEIVSLVCTEASATERGALAARLRGCSLDNITEYGRVVHAEMEALLACARNSADCRGATLYCTTFPCHNCAKHIIAAGIERVVYVEPYPKSKAIEFHDESAFLGRRTDHPRSKKVAFEQFEGVGPRRFFDLFSMMYGSGYPIRRKDESTGSATTWASAGSRLRMPMLPWSYLQREQIAAHTFEKHLRRLGRG